MKRQPPVLLIVAMLASCWLAMQAVHEFGHFVAAVLSGGRVAQVKLHPAVISYTLLAVNPHPYFVAWMGPIVGVAIPLLLWAAATYKRARGWYVLQFFAGFCLVANGAYLAGGAFYEMGDAADLLRHGAAKWFLILCGVPAVCAGLWLWNGLAARFGVGKDADDVDSRVTFVVTCLLISVIALELMLAS